MSPSLQGTAEGGPWGPARGRRAFTLMELLLVVFIAMLLASLVMPAFLRSFRGAQLRSAVRSAVMIHRHARNLAILRQRHVAVRVDQEQNLFDVIVLPPQAGDRPQDLEEWLQQTWNDEETQPSEEVPPADEPMVRHIVGRRQETNAPPPVAGPSSALVLEVRRNLPAGVRIASVEVNRPEAEAPGPIWIFYYPSGLCEGFVLHLQDERARTAELSADPLTGQVTVEYLNENAGLIENSSAIRPEGPWSAAADRA